MTGFKNMFQKHTTENDTAKVSKELSAGSQESSRESDTSSAKNDAYCVNIEHLGISFRNTKNSTVGNDAGNNAADNSTFVLKNVTMSIKQGEFVSLIGRSGCGKTTLLKIISGLLTPSEGSVHATSRQAIGFQDARLIPWLSVSQNVVFGMEGSKQELEDIAHRALCQIQLEGFDNKWPSQLSGGQQQRVSLARALVRNPELLLLDEPFGALDALTRFDMQDLLNKLQAQYGWSTLMVTHDIAEAVRLSNRILMIKNGEIHKEWHINREHLDAQNRPVNHSEIEDELRAALQ